MKINTQLRNLRKKKARIEASIADKKKSMIDSIVTMLVIVFIAIIGTMRIYHDTGSVHRWLVSMICYFHLPLVCTILPFVSYVRYGQIKELKVEKAEVEELISEKELMGNNNH